MNKRFLKNIFLKNVLKTLQLIKKRFFSSLSPSFFYEQCFRNRNQPPGTAMGVFDFHNNRTPVWSIIYDEMDGTDQGLFSFLRLCLYHLFIILSCRLLWWCSLSRSLIPVVLFVRVSRIACAETFFRRRHWGRGWPRIETDEERTPTENRNET